MKIRLSKKLFTAFAATALLLGAGVVNANSISIVNANGADLTPNDILLGVDDGGTGTFTMNINVTLDPGITAGLGVTDLSWNPNVLTLDNATTSLGPGLFLGSTVATPTNGGSTQLSMLDFVPNPSNPNTFAMTGSFTWATLTFSYNGPGNALIDILPIVEGASGTGLGWETFGTGVDIIFDTVNNATVSAVPVPPAMLLFVSALAGLGISGRRKVKA